jgi:hypothetical protein
MGDDDEKYDPLEIVRYSRGRLVFGLAPSSIKAKIDAGLIPAPIPLSEDGAALGWTRQTIADYHARMAKLGAEKRAATALLPTEKREKPLALVNAKRKRKLRPAAAKTHGKQT